MPTLLYSLAGGTWVVPATAVLAAAILLSAVARRRAAVITLLVVSLLATSTVVVSAVAFDGWFVGVWSTAVLAWLGTGLTGRGKLLSPRSIPRLAALATTVVAGGIELNRERLPTLPPSTERVLYVIGDSVSAGLGRPGESTWPTRLAAAHALRVVDLSRAGSTVGQATRRAAALGDRRGVVLIEIGGNDLIGRSGARRFGQELSALAAVAAAPGRQVVMFELPRFPFDDAYGLEQRQVAERHHIPLVPRRAFAALLASPGSTIDGVHLSNLGHQRMATLVWQIVGSSIGPVDRAGP